MSISFQPDYRLVKTIKEAEKNIEGFKFEGPGWYLFKNDTILVLPFDRLVVELFDPLEKKENEKFVFMFYTDRNPIETFKLIANAPIRTN